MNSKVALVVVVLALIGAALFVRSRNRRLRMPAIAPTVAQTAASASARAPKR